MPLKMAVALADALVQLRWESGRPRRKQAGLVQPAGKPRFSRACPAMRGSVGSVWIAPAAVTKEAADGDSIDATQSVSITKCSNCVIFSSQTAAKFPSSQVDTIWIYQ